MKPLNHNSLGIILSVGVPTTVILLGLLWMMRRKKGKDDDDDDAETDEVKSMVGDYATKEKDTGMGMLESSGNEVKLRVTQNVLQERGDTSLQERHTAKSTETNSRYLHSEQHPQLQLKEKDKDVNQSCLQAYVSSQNSVKLESKATTLANPSSLGLQSTQGIPVTEKMVVESSPVMSRDCWQSSSVTGDGGADASKSDDSPERRLESRMSFMREVSSEHSAQTADSSLKSPSGGRSADNSLQSDSSLGSGLSQTVCEEIQEELASATCFSQAQSPGVSCSKDSTDVRRSGHGGLTAGKGSEASDQENPAAQEIVPENVSQNCQSPLSTPLQPASQQQRNESPQVSGSEQTSDVNESRFKPAAEVSKDADDIIQEEGRNNSVCDVQTADSDESVSVQDVPKETSISLLNDSTLEVNSSEDTRVSVSTLILSSQSAKITTSNCQSPEEKSGEHCPDASATEQGLPGTDIRATKTKELNTVEASNSSESQESNKAEVKDSSMDKSKEDGDKLILNKDVKTSTKTSSEDGSDIVENGKSGSGENPNHCSSAVIVASSSADSSANSKSASTVSEVRTESSNSVSGKKADSKNSSKSSKKQKAVSSPSKSTPPHSKSSSPSKSKQTSPKTAAPSPKSGNANGHGGRAKNQSSTIREEPAEQNDVGKSSAAVSENGRMDSGSPICDTNSEASNDSGRGGSVGDTLLSLPAGDVINFDFNFPSELCGRLIGRGGKNIQYMKDRSGASIVLTRNPFTPEFQICSVQGNQGDVHKALEMIRRKFPLSQYPRLDMVALMPSPPAPVVLPEVMELSLPEGVSIDVVVSAVVNAGHIFIQQPTHPSFPSLERLNYAMNQCYEDPAVPSVPASEARAGSICAAESEGQWYRVQVTQVLPMEDECEVKYVDYGGFSRVHTSMLKQMRMDFMTLPFQAVECYLANITPLQDEEYFSQKAADVLVELTSGQMLQGQVVCRGEDSGGFVHLYRVSGNKVLMINREMVNKEVVRWIEIL